MDKDIEKCTTLEDLFNKWKTKEGNEFFCRDGFINKETYEEQVNKVLFIAKESNVSKGTDNDFFWLQSVANGKSDSKILSRRISIMTNAYYNNFSCVNKSLDNLQKIAYMNINKSGGSSRTNATKLWEYANNHKDYIKKEIEIINPNLIVCCGKLVYEIISDILDTKSTNPKIIEVYHPSYFYISDKKYLEQFKNALVASQHQP